MSAATLIFPHQLFDPHPALAKNREVVFIEDSLVFGGDTHVGLQFHAQKLVLHRASMKTYAAALKKRGYDITYIDYASGKDVCDHLKGIADEFHYCDPTDFLLSKRLARLSDAKHVTYDTPMFLSPPEWLEGQFAGDKKPFMARFYENQRKRMDILVDAEGNPEGGRFSFDDENRKSMPKKGLDVPPDPTSRSTSYISEAKKYVEKTFPEAHGNLDNFHYPVSHASAQTWLEKFFTERFALFGPYEDAISGRERVLFHSILTPMLNCGLLTPQQVIEDALAYAQENDVPLNSLEGFVRQIIGWREFMRGMYDKVGVASRNSNFFNFEDKPIPKAFYTATTGIDPIDIAIQRTLITATATTSSASCFLGISCSSAGSTQRGFTTGSWNSSSTPTIG